MFHSRASAPDEPVRKAFTCPREPLTYRVWVNQPYYTEDPTPWKCVAAFQYLQDALDWIAENVQDAGRDCVFQSPADCCEIKATDRRVVWRPEAAPEQLESMSMCA